MPKTPKQILPNKEKNFIYHTQSPKKTHCPKTINNYNYNQPSSEFLANRPIDHWTENKDNSNWEYFEFFTTQLTISLNEFRKTQNWYYWNQSPLIKEISS